jgi:hypothetical protein
MWELGVKRNGRSSYPKYGSELWFRRINQCCKALKAEILMKTE